MAVTIDGTTGVSLVQDGVITDANLPEGSVLQVVTNHFTNNSGSASASFADVAGSSTTITPISTSSTILVMCSIAYIQSRSTDTAYAGIQLVRGSTILYTPASNSVGPFGPALVVGGASSIANRSRWHMLYEDNPSTTNATTYKVQFRVYNTDSNQNLIINETGGNSGEASTVVLMEIAG